MSYSEAFSPNYITARERFRAASSSVGYQDTAYPIEQVSPTGEELTIDVAIGGSSNPRRCVVISSGLHGVEGFLGSAIQLTLLENHQLLRSLSPDFKVIFIHALNPYGFAWRRRWNENNIDLNRNFLLSEEIFDGSPKDYPKFNSFLNSTSSPSRFEPYIFQSLWLILKYGMTSLKNTFPVGQYDFPKGLFFGGHAPSKTQEILASNLPQWIGNASEVVHIDFHTGLGRWGTYKLLFDGSATSESCSRLAQRFGAEKIEPNNTEGVSYPIRGGLKTWCQALLPECRYDLLTAEFGTYSTIKVLKALRAENRAYWWGKSDQNYEWTKNQLVEMFAPRSRKWREQCLTQGLDVCKRALMD
ncbi:M14 family metallopeptidase [Microcoleus sp. K5-D4]|uniref:M14 family metallopeptidase n=1 Tax=Microcoleus sp. K5-D4 TaxID=2818801 RepID=UPI002FD4B64E